jgi:heat shock protein HtpX
MTVASSVGMLAGLIGRMAMWGAMFSGAAATMRTTTSSWRLRSGSVRSWSYVVAYLLTLSLSRYRELSADSLRAILIGKPSVLASALVRLNGDMGQIPTNDLRRVEGMNAFFFTPAFSKGSAAALLSTHPTLEKRLEQLAQLERHMNA